MPPPTASHEHDRGPQVLSESVVAPRGKPQRADRWYSVRVYTAGPQHFDSVIEYMKLRADPGDATGEGDEDLVMSFGLASALPPALELEAVPGASAGCRSYAGPLGRPPLRSRRSVPA